MMDTIAKAIWPVRPPHRVRDPNKPMKVLCLGMPRTGTDSLRTALVQLGYKGIWHGFECPLTRSDEPVCWNPLLEAKARGDSQPAENFDWDTMLGDLEVMMDMPPAIFAEELLDYYPDAKVILTRRKDMDAWHRSLQGAMDQVFGWGLWFLRFWDAEFFWWYKMMVLCVLHISNYQSFGAQGKVFADSHYERLEKKLKADGRPYLNWYAQDGWGPLCKHLGKEAPSEEFPWENRGGDEFQKKAEEAMGKMAKRAIRNFGVFVGTVAIVAGYILYSQ